MSTPTSSMPSSHLLGLSFIFLVTIIWSGASFLIQHLYREFEFRSPFLLTYISSSLFIVLLPTRLLWEQIMPLISTCARRKFHMLFGKGEKQSSTTSLYRSSAADSPISSPKIVNDENDDKNCNRQPDEVVSPVERNIRKTTTNEWQTREEKNNRDNYDRKEIIQERDDQPHYYHSQRINNEKRDDTTNDDDDHHFQNTNTLPKKTPPPPLATTLVNNKPITPLLMTHYEHFLLSLRIAPLMFLTNYFYNLSLAHTSLSSATVLANTGSLFTSLFAVWTGDERFSFLKFIGVMLCLLGSIIVGRGDVVMGEEDGVTMGGMIVGDVAGLISAVGYGAYTMMIRLSCPKDDDDGQISMPLLFGYVGLCVVVGLSPMALFVLSHSADNGVSLTRTILYYLVAKGLLDNVVSDYLWARAVVLSGATVATVGLGLTIPLAFFGDWVMRGVVPSDHAVMGAMTVLVGFVFVNVGGVWRFGDGGRGGVVRRVVDVCRCLYRIVMNQNFEDIRIHVGTRSSKKLR